MDGEHKNDEKCSYKLVPYLTLSPSYSHFRTSIVLNPFVTAYISAKVVFFLKLLEMLTKVDARIGSSFRDATQVIAWVPIIFGARSERVNGKQR